MGMATKRHQGTPRKEILMTSESSNSSKHLGSQQKDFREQVLAVTNMGRS